MSDATSHFVEHGEVRIHYLDVRPPEHSEPAPLAPPIVFVPGMTCVAADYPKIAADTGRRTIVIDVRGHGQSSAPESGYTLDDHAGDVGAVVAAAVDGDVHLMTFSRGTCYALRWASHHLERVRSISIGDYPGREIRMPGGIVESFLATTWRGTPVAERVDAHAMLQTFRDSRARPLWDVLDAIDGPITVVKSTSERPLTDEDWQRYGDLAGDVRMHRFGDSPHDIFRPDRARFARLVAETAAAGDARRTATSDHSTA